MFLSQFKAPAQQRVTVSKFGGYDARRRAPLGSFARMENLTGDGYPTLSVREKRKTIAALDKPNGLAAKDSLIWVDGRTLYINGLAIDLALTDGEKQLVSMGAYLLIWPDKKYVNTQNLSDRGSLENAIQTNGYAMTEEWAAFFAENHFLVGISLDGDKALHDENRLDAQGKGTYRPVMHAIQLLQRCISTS